MLDILMPAHKRNYPLMARRALTVKGLETDTELEGSLVSTVDRTSLDGKVILSLEGGKHQDFEPAESYLGTQNLPWQIILSDEVTGYYEAMMRGLEKCTSPMVAVIPPWIEITDDLWVPRMMWAMKKDPAALLCSTWNVPGPAKDLAPHVALQRKWPGGEILFARRAELLGVLCMVDPGNLYESLAKAAAASSWHIWAHPGIRFKTHKHEAHEGKKVGQEVERRPADRVG